MLSRYDIGCLHSGQDGRWLQDAEQELLPIFDRPPAICDGHWISSAPPRNIALTRELEGYIKAQVVGGHHASEVGRAALRLLIERDNRASRSRSTLSFEPTDA